MDSAVPSSVPSTPLAETSAARVETCAPAPPTAAPPASVAQPMIVFAYSLLRREFAALKSHQPSGLSAPEPEAIHQMRIASRRLRVALRLFRRMLPAESAATFAKEFRWFARTLGAVRDLDVYAGDFGHYANMIPPEQLPDLGGYELHLRRTRAEARAKLGELLIDPRCSALLTAFEGSLQDAPSAAALRRWRSFRVVDGAAKYLDKSIRRVRKSGRKIRPDSDADRLHRLRIRAKRLRYELEFFAEPFPALDKGVKAVKRLQDTLGDHQDACTACERLRAYAKSLDPGKRAIPQGALMQLLHHQERKAADARERFAAEWQHFERAIDRIDLDQLLA